MINYMMNISEINNQLLRVNKLLDIIETHQLQSDVKKDNANKLYGGNFKKDTRKLFINGLPLGLRSVSDDDVNLDIMDIDNKIYSSMKTTKV